MTGHAEQDHAELATYLRLYQLEPLGRLLKGDQESLPVVGALFVLIYFGVLLVIHTLAGDPVPTTLGELFGHPTTHYYYPNLIAIAYVMIGNPLYFVLLVSMRTFVPLQLQRLSEAELLAARPADSALLRRLDQMSRAQGMQFTLTTLLPLAISLLLTLVSIGVYRPASVADWYATFLSLLGNYVKFVLLVQIAYLFLILARYKLRIVLQPTHPDGCGGLSPLGNLALISYAFLFVLAALQAVGTSGGGTALERALTSAGGAAALIYLWLLFPLAVIYIFERLIFQPHRALVAASHARLEVSGRAWTARHRALLDQVQATPPDAPLPNLKDALEALEAWTRLEQVLREMPTWPISTGTFRLLSTLVNPLLPMLLPAVTALLQP